MIGKIKTMKNEDLKVTLVIPTLNEYEAMKEIMPLIKKEWYDELIVVDGGSTDATVDYCRENGYPVIIQEGKGLPLALGKAFKLFKNNIFDMLEGLFLFSNIKHNDKYKYIPSDIGLCP